MQKYFDLENWNLMRVVRLQMGGFVVFEGIRTGQYLLGTVGILFFIQGLMGFGCGCKVPQNFHSSKYSKKNEINFDEIK